MASRIFVNSATRTLAATVLVVLGSACGGDGPTPPPSPTSLTLVPDTDIRLYVIGETRQVTATPKDESGNPVSATVTWTSSNQAVATVTSTGATSATVTATGLGSATIRASVSATVFKEVTVIVQQPQFNVNANNACQSPDLRSYRVEAQTANLIIVSDIGNPSGGFTAQDYAAIAATFESLVWPVVTQNFGLPADIDGNGKVIAFYTRAVNELTPAGSQSVVGGFFFGRDLFPKTGNSRLGACPSSNEAEMFYMLVPDPSGEVNNNVRTTELVRRITVGVLGHEFQHLINSSRRLFINQSALWPETTYMEEGLSHIAEEMIFYEASGGLAPKMNVGISAIQTSQARVDAFNSYMASNSGRFSSYLKNPSGNAPYDEDDDLPTRGAIWSFLRYLADRGTASPLAEPACTGAVLTVGQQCSVEGSAAASFTVGAGSAAGEFTIVAFAKDLPLASTNPPQAGSITTVANATSTISVIGPPNPWAAGGPSLSTFGAASLRGVAAPLLDDSFHARLRRIERRELPKRVPGARAAYSMRHRSSPRMYAAARSTPLLAAAAVEAVWGQLVNSNDTGMVNLRGRFGQDISGAAQDWAVAHYVDDTGLPAQAQHTHPSWNFRTLLAAFSSNDNAYPLQVHALTGQVTQAMIDGGAAYYRFGLAVGTTSTVQFTVGGSAPPANLKLVVVRTK